jgi:hypothetical protein
MSLGTEWNWVIAGTVSALLVVGLSVLTSVPFLLAVGLAVLVFAGLVLILSPRRLFEGVTVTTFGRGGLDPARTALERAKPSIDGLRLAAGRIRDTDVAPRVKRVAAIAADVFAKVEQNPMLVPKAERFLGEYVQRAAAIVDGFVAASGKGLSAQNQVEDLREIIHRLEDAFGRYAGSLTDAELDPLDAALKPVEASLNQGLLR